MKYNFINKPDEEVKYIEDSKNYYVSKSGNIYRKLNNKWIKKLNFITCGYLYVGIIMNDDRMHNCRVHRLVAQAYIENPNNFPIVEHIDNNKMNPNVENLMWSTHKHNSQKSYDDGLSINKKGYEDSQSLPVIMYDRYTNIELNRFGSITIASKESGICKSTIARQCKQKKQARLKYYFRYDERCNQTTIESIVS